MTVLQDVIVISGAERRGAERRSAAAQAKFSFFKRSGCIGLVGPWGSGRDIVAFLKIPKNGNFGAFLVVQEFSGWFSNDLVANCCE